MTRRQESWASSPRMTETCLFSTASQTDAGTHGASCPVIHRAEAAKGMAATFGLMYFITCCLIAVATCYVTLRLYLVQWSASLHHIWQQNLFHALTAWFFNFVPVLSSDLRYDVSSGRSQLFQLKLFRMPFSWMRSTSHRP